MKVTVLPNQGIFDIALQTTGTIETIPDIMKENNLSDFPPELEAGQELSITVNFKNTAQRRAAELISARPIATAGDSSYGGIGAMQIETTFIVS